MQTVIVVGLVGILVWNIWLQWSRKHITKLMVLTAEPLIEAHIKELCKSECTELVDFFAEQAVYNITVQCHDLHGIVVADTKFTLNVERLIRERLNEHYYANKIMIVTLGGVNEKV